MTRKSKRDSTSQESLELSKVTLPILAQETASALEIVTQALGVSRDILPSDEEIAHAWSELPRVLSRIPPELRTEPHVRMCVAVANGLFDAGINYSWNSAVVELRNKVRRFGIHVVPQIIGKDFDEGTLVDLKDAELLDLCLSLNLITEEGYFFLDQCRETRNNFSSAHPALGAVDDHEFLTFLNRCAKYALTSTRNPRGVDTQSFIQAIHGNKFSVEQEDEWIVRTQETHEAQRELLVGMLHGIYCDQESSEESRLNALGICQRLAEEFTPKVKSDLLNRHSEYIAHGKIERQKASQAFFEKVDLLSLLSENEQHTLISNACSNLLAVHREFNNFYNEPPFAERLYELTKQVAVPQTTQAEFVHTVTGCAIGNQYGVSNAAYPFYEKMIQSYSPREVGILLRSPRKSGQIASKVRFSQCKRKFQQIIELLDPASVPTKYKGIYNKLKK